jgi:DNA/RNA-binding domain of Phe-tRNA-synthetase-like protein
MVPISISEEIRSKCPQLKLLVLSGDVNVLPSAPGLKKLQDILLKELSKEFSQKPVESDQWIAEMDNAFRMVGDDPIRHHHAAKALMQRVVRGKGLYHINSLVDTTIYLSLKSRIPIGVYDEGKLNPPLELIIGKDGSFQGLDRKTHNTANRILLHEWCSWWT